MEINQKPYLNVEEPHMCQQLRVIYGMQSFFTFDLDGHLALDHNIGAKATVQLDTVVDQRHWLLPLKRKPQVAQFVSNASLVGRFQKSRP